MDIDLILCRNVLMYIQEEERRVILKGFFDTLCRGGILIVDPSETHLVADLPFQKISRKGVLFFQKPEECSSLTREPRKNASVHPPSPVPSPVNGPEIGQDPYDPPALLSLARMEMISGAFDKAEQVVDQLLQMNDLSAEGYYIKGLISLHDSREAEAKECFRRCLFLDASHEGAQKALEETSS